jgi:hypothetical protein
MSIEPLEDEGMFTLSYCTVCDSATSGGDNVFLKSLGELQRQHKVELELQTCKCEDALPNMLWKIKFVVE